MFRKVNIYKVKHRRFLFLRTLITSYSFNVDFCVYCYSLGPKLRTTTVNDRHTETRLFLIFRGFWVLLKIIVYGSGVGQN